MESGKSPASLNKSFITLSLRLSAMLAMYRRIIRLVDRVAMVANGRFIE